MRVDGNATSGGPMTGGSVPLPTGPTRYAGDPFTALEKAHTSHSPIGPSARTRAQLAALEGATARPTRQPERPAAQLKTFEKPRRARPRLDRAQVVGLYESGLSGIEIAEHLGCDAGSVYYQLRQAGVPRRDRNDTRRENKADPAALAAGYASGKSLLKVAREHHCHQSQVRAAVLAAGGQIRPIGRPGQAAAAAARAAQVKGDRS